MNQNKIKERINKFNLEYYHSSNKKKFIARRLINQDKKKNPHLYPKVCIICNSTENIKFHHSDYDFPYSVYPLCKSHHIKLHREVSSNV